jgi:hypothetical protein
MIQGYQSSQAMTQTLCSYIADDRYIKDLVDAEFTIPISLAAIARIRAQCERVAENMRHATEWREDGADPYYSREYENRVSYMDRANTVFVKRLRSARPCA